MRSLCLPAFYPDDHNPEDRARRWLWQGISGEPDASDPDEEVPEFGLTQATVSWSSSVKDLIITRC